MPFGGYRRRYSTTRRTYSRGYRRAATKRSYKRVSRRLPRGSTSASIIANSASLQGGVATVGPQIKNITRNTLSYVVVNNLSYSALGGAAIFFSLSNSGGTTDFGGLFDAYRIDRVTVEWIYDRPIASTPAVTTANAFVPNIGVVADFDDATFVATSPMDTLKQYDTFLYKPLTHPVSMSIVPRIAVAAYNGNGVFNGYVNSKAQWIDMNSPGVEHYGIKFAVDTSPSDGNNNLILGVIAVRIKYELSFRSCR
jgi:hypothetical protein